MAIGSTKDALAIFNNVETILIKIKKCVLLILFITTAPTFERIREEAS